MYFLLDFWVEYVQIYEFHPVMTKTLTTSSEETYKQIWHISYVSPVTIVQVFFSSNRFPSFSEDIVDEFGHGFWATGATAALLGFASQTGIAHNLGEHEQHLLVMFGCGELVKLTAALRCQPLALFPVHLTHVAQVLLIAHQENHRVRIPAVRTEKKRLKLSSKVCIKGKHVIRKSDLYSLQY